jgi:hypothetical protein
LSQTPDGKGSFEGLVLYRHGNRPDGWCGWKQAEPLCGQWTRGNGITGCVLLEPATSCSNWAICSRDGEGSGRLYTSTRVHELFEQPGLHSLHRDEKYAPEPGGGAGNAASVVAGLFPLREYQPDPVVGRRDPLCHRRVRWTASPSPHRSRLARGALDRGLVAVYGAESLNLAQG